MPRAGTETDLDPGAVARCGRSRLAGPRHSAPDTQPPRIPSPRIPRSAALLGIAPGLKPGQGTGGVTCAFRAPPVKPLPCDPTGSPLLSVHRARTQTRRSPRSRGLMTRHQNRGAWVPFTTQERNQQLSPLWAVRGLVFQP